MPRLQDCVVTHRLATKLKSIGFPQNDTNFIYGIIPGRKRYKLAQVTERDDLEKMVAAPLPDELSEYLPDWCVYRCGHRFTAYVDECVVSADSIAEAMGELIVLLSAGGSIKLKRRKV